MPKSMALTERNSAKVTQSTRIASYVFSVYLSDVVFIFCLCCSCVLGRRREERVEKVLVPDGNLQHNGMRIPQCMHWVEGKKKNW